MASVTLNLDHLNDAELAALHDMLETRLVRVRLTTDARRKHRRRTTLPMWEGRLAEAEREFAPVDAESCIRDRNAAEARGT